MVTFHQLIFAVFVELLGENEKKSKIFFKRFQKKGLCYRMMEKKL
jgi:hypothetical protein